LGEFCADPGAGACACSSAGTAAGSRYSIPSLPTRNSI
jgi:hypothetical protein